MRLALSLFLLILLTNTGLASTDDCKEDIQIQNFLEKSANLIGPSADTWFPCACLDKMAFSVNGKSLQWIGAHWYGPESGALFVVDGDIPLVALPEIAVEKIGRGPVLEEVGPTASVDFQSSSGTGYKRIETAIVAYIDVRIEILWQHDFFELNAVLPKKPATEKKYNVTVSKDGKRIEVIGKVTTFPPPAATMSKKISGTVRELPPESFCWAASKKRYLTCDK